MAVRGRILSASLATSRKFSRLESNDHRLMYVMLIPHVDAEGRHDAEPALLAGKCYTTLGFTADQIMVGLGDMSNCGLIHLYQVHDDLFLEIVDFHVHQTIYRKKNGDPIREAPSRIPDRPKRAAAAWSPGPPRDTAAELQQNCSRSAANTVDQSKVKQYKGEPLTGGSPPTDSEPNDASGSSPPEAAPPSTGLRQMNPTTRAYIDRMQARPKTEEELRLATFVTDLHERRGPPS